MQKPAHAPEGAPTSPRCRPGDLAVVIEGEHIGLLVTVLHAERPIFCYGGIHAKFNGAHHWVVESSRPVIVDKFKTDPDSRLVVTTVTRAVSDRFLVPDPMLRPVRDGEGTDETLTWADKPITEQVPA